MNVKYSGHPMTCTGHSMTPTGHPMTPTGYTMTSTGHPNVALLRMYCFQIYVYFMCIPYDGTTQLGSHHD